MEPENCTFPALGNVSTACTVATVATPSQVEWLVYYVGSWSCYELKLPGVPISFYLGSFASIAEATVVMLCGLAASSLLGFLCYHLRETSWLGAHAKNVILGSVGIGIWILPLAVLSLLSPFYSVMSNFTLGLAASIAFFRWGELFFRTGPAGFDSSAHSCALYFATSPEVLFGDDGRAKAAPKGRCRGLFVSLLLHFVGLMLVLACAEAWDGDFLSPRSEPSGLLALGLPWSLPALWLRAAWVCLMLTCVIDAQRFALSIFGVESHQAMRHPLLLSTSVKDFWGRRWNLLIHRLMHRNFFTPLAPLWGPRAGAIAAFLASALFHEYAWFLTNWSVEAYRPGGPLLFFGVQFVLLTGETLLKKTALAALFQRLPAPVLVVLTTVAILPFGPIFLKDLAQGGLMADTARVMPHPRFVAA